MTNRNSFEHHKFYSRTWGLVEEENNHAEHALMQAITNQSFLEDEIFLANGGTYQILIAQTLLEKLHKRLLMSTWYIYLVKKCL